MKHALILAFAFASTACAPSSSPGSAIGASGLTTLGQPTRVGRLRITPQAVVEDSRCPINARCVWAGRLVLKTRIEGAGWRETVDLTLGQPYGIHGAGVALVSAEPGRMAGSVPAPAANLFGFEAR